MQVVLRGTLQKATTLVDGGWRISLDLPEKFPVQDLMELKGEDLTIVLMPFSMTLPVSNEDTLDR